MLLGGNLVGLGNGRVGRRHRRLGQIGRDDWLHQSGTHLGRLARVLDLHAQRQAPAFGFRVVAHAVFNQFGVVTDTDLTAHVGIRGQRRQRWTFEVDQVGNAAIRLTDQVRLFDVTGRTQSLRYPGAVRRVNRRFVHSPVHPVGEVQWLARLGHFFRTPERNDVVVGFVGGRNFYQINGAFAPLALRLDPGAWALVVAVIEVFVVAEVATTLQQTEATQVLDAEVAYGQVFRVVQWTPDPLAVTGMDRQTAGVVQFTTVVEDFRRLVGTEQEHAGQRCDTQFTDLVTQEHLRLDVDNGVAARTQDQTVGTGSARRIQQGEDHQVLVTRLRLLNPELAKTWELFTRRQRGINRQATGREAVGVALADNAEVTRAEHGHDFVLLVGLVDRVQHTETGITQLFGGLGIELHVAEVETTRVVFDLFDGVRRDFVDFHRRIEMHALVIEGQLERRLLISPLGFFRQKTNFLIVREFHVAELVRQVTARRFVFLRGQLFCLGRYIIQTECPKLAGAEQAEQCRARYQSASEPFGRQFWCITGTNNHEQPSPKTDQKTNGQL
ncbi:hypothetical protein D3C86_895980 [compost metagenome]